MDAVWLLADCVHPAEILMVVVPLSPETEKVTDRSLRIIWLWFAFNRTSAQMPWRSGKSRLVIGRPTRNRRRISEQVFGKEAEPSLKQQCSTLLLAILNREAISKPVDFTRTMIALDQ